MISYLEKAKELSALIFLAKEQKNLLSLEEQTWLDAAISKFENSINIYWNYNTFFYILEMLQKIKEKQQNTNKLQE